MQFKIHYYITDKYRGLEQFRILEDCLWHY
jgi:hypothetical protein